MYTGFLPTRGSPSELNWSSASFLQVTIRRVDSESADSSWKVSHPLTFEWGAFFNMHTFFLEVGLSFVHTYPDYPFKCLISSTQIGPIHGQYCMMMLKMNLCVVVLSWQNTWLEAPSPLCHHHSHGRYSFFGIEWIFFWIESKGKSSFEYFFWIESKKKSSFE